MVISNIFTSFIVALLVIGCKSAVNDSSSLLKSSSQVVILQAPLISFSWSSGRGDLPQHLSNQLDTAFEKNSKLAPGKRPPNGLFGYGLYVANDPVLSIQFGDELSCIELKENSDVLMPPGKFTGDPVPLEIAVKSSASTVLYSYESGILPYFEGGTASAVIRDISAIDIEKSRKISFTSTDATNFLSEAELRRATRALDSGDFCDSISVYQNKLSALSYGIYSAIKSFKLPQNKDDTGEIFGKKMEPISKDRFLGIETIMGSKSLLNELAVLDPNMARLSKEKLKVELNALLRLALTDRGNDLTPQNLRQYIFALNASKILILPEGIESGEEFAKKREEALEKKLEQWTLDHPHDFKFAKKLWSYWMTRSLSHLATAK